MTLLEGITNAPKPTQEHLNLVESYLQFVDKKYDSTELRVLLMKAAYKAIETGDYQVIEEDVKRCLSKHKWLRSPLLVRCL